MVKPQSALVEVLDQYHSLDRFDASRRDVMKSVVGEVFLVDINYNSHERAYAYNSDTRFRDGQSVHGLIGDTSYQMVVQLPAERNDEVIECHTGDSIQAVLSPIKWDSAYDRLSCIAILDIDHVVTEDPTDAEGHTPDSDSDSVIEANDELADGFDDEFPEETEIEIEEEEEEEERQEEEDQEDESLPSALELGPSDNDSEDSTETEQARIVPSETTASDDHLTNESDLEEEELSLEPEAQNTANAASESSNPVEAVELSDTTQDASKDPSGQSTKDSRSLDSPHGEPKKWKAKMEEFLVDIDIANTNKWLLISSAILVLMSFVLAIITYGVSLVFAAYIVEDVKELGMKSRFSDTLYKQAQIQLWAGAGMAATLVAQFWNWII